MSDDEAATWKGEADVDEEGRRETRSGKGPTRRGGEADVIPVYFAPTRSSDNKTEAGGIGESQRGVGCGGWNRNWEQM